MAKEKYYPGKQRPPITSAVIRDSIMPVFDNYIINFVSKSDSPNMDIHGTPYKSFILKNDW